MHMYKKSFIERDTCTKSIVSTIPQAGLDIQKHVREVSVTKCRIIVHGTAHCRY